MKLKEYAEKIKVLAEKHPDAEVVFSSDEEGNQFSPVWYEPTAGNYEAGEFDGESEDINAVCVN